MTARMARTVRWHVAALMLMAAARLAPPAHADEPTQRPAAVSWPASALRSVRQIAIQHHGRYKPFDSFARETLQTITGGARLDREDPVTTVLSILAEPERWQQVPLVAVPFVPLREPLGMSRKTARISYTDLVATRALMRMLPPIVQKQQQDDTLTMLENETMDLFQRFVAMNALLEQKLELVPPPTGTSAWLSIAQPEGYPPAQQREFRTAWDAVLSAARRHDASALAVNGRHLAELFERANPSAYPSRWRRRLEVFYNRSQPFHLARLFYLFACVMFLLHLGKRHATGTGGWIVFAGGAGLHATGIAMRVILGERPPVSNFFETMLWLPFVAVILAWVLARLYRARDIGFAAALLAVITLTLADAVPLDSSITPVVAVLRSNKWLTIHVLTVVASYGALTLAMVLAHIYSGLFLRRHRSRLPAVELLLYRTIQVGVVLLAGGIMLGAVWANASWGRYWGWDPKETWALITLLWFLAVLHGRVAGWTRGVGLAVATIGGFFLLLMTYYGVSFYLVGLHSYAGGHATPLPLVLVVYLIAETVFLSVVGFTALRRRRPA